MLLKEGHYYEFSGPRELQEFSKFINDHESMTEKKDLIPPAGQRAYNEI